MPTLRITNPGAARAAPLSAFNATGATMAKRKTKQATTDNAINTPPIFAPRVRRTEIVPVRMTADEKRAVVSEATRRGVTVGEIMRAALAVLLRG